MQQYFEADQIEKFIILLERKGRHRAILRGLLQKKEKLLALSKAVQYKKEGILQVLPQSLNIHQLAHECIQHFTRKETYNEEAVKKAVNCLDSKPMKIRYLTDANLIKEAIKIHAQSEDYDRAFELVLMHGEYEEGIVIAKKIKNSKMQCKFQLYSLYEKLQHDARAPSCTKSIKQLLRVSESSKCQLVQAEVLLLEAKLDSNIDSCLKAIEIYKDHTYYPGGLEAFKILMNLRDKLKPESIWITAEEILQYCKNANTLLQLFSKNPQKLLPNELKFVKQAMEFHHVQKLLHDQYLLPPYLGYWLTSSKLQVKFTTKEIYSILGDHYYQLAKPQLTKETITIALSSASKIHNKLKKLSVIPKSQRSSFKKYVEALSDIIELNNSFQCYRESTNILLDIYSPLQAINNQAMHREDFSLLITLTAVHETFENQCKILLASDDLVTSLDKLFLAWHVSSIASKNIGDLQRLLHQPTSNQFMYTHGHGTRHIFLPWIDLCNAVAVPSKLRLITACSHVWHGIFRGTLHHQQVRESISDMNLIYIVMIQTIILLVLTSYAWDIKFYLPQVYRHVITTFDIFNVQSEKPRSLLTACKRELFCLENNTKAGQSALSLLVGYLKFLVGCCSSAINVLYQALQGGNECIIRYCIASIIVIAVNLYIARPKSDNAEVHRCLCVLLTYLKSSVEKDNNTNLAPIYYRLCNTRSVNDLLLLLQDTLLPMGNDMRIDQIFILYYDSEKWHIKFEPKPLIQSNPAINIVKLNIDPYLFKRLANSASQTLPEPSQSIDEQASAGDADSLRDVNIDLEVEQKDKITILKLNKIENNYCHACGMKIDVQLQESHGFERHANIDDQYDINDKHIEGRIHEQNLRNYLKYEELKEKFDEQLAFVLQELEKLRAYGNANYVYIEKSTKWEHKISTLQNDSLESSYDWLRRQHLLSSKIEILKECLKDLRDPRYHQLKQEVAYQNDDATSPLAQEYDYYENEILPNRKH